MSLTDKQKEVLAVIVKGNPDGSFCDLDEVIAGVSYDTTKASIQFIIRNLMAKGLIEKKSRERRRARKRVVLAPTPEGYRILNRQRFAGMEELARVFIE